MSGLSAMSRTPGVIPCRVRVASMSAMTGSPGMPRASVGTIAPPATALLEDSAATRPSGSPFPKFSPFLERRLAEE